MKVRVPDLLGPNVHEASFVEMDDELRDGQKKLVLQVRPDGGKPMHMESYSAEDVELIEASPEEEKQLADLGWGEIRRPA